MSLRFLSRDSWRGRSPSQLLRIELAVARTRLRTGDIFSFYQSFGGKCYWKWIIKILRRLKEGHLRFLDLKKVEIIEKLKCAGHLKANEAEGAQKQPGAEL